MSKIIASTYEIEKEIGSGGSGIVYLAKHLRLGKTVVLKADKRTLATRTEVLRTEVDILKNLNHPYIPRVYDFLEEDGIVYTVMDYIEGESLDRPLKRGERFSQAQVIEWGCQVLSALQYMHSQPPHGILHGDVKPANIMLTPEGDIRLIDFNIALALGEEKAVVIGRSQGYASPEHYGQTIGGMQQPDREPVSGAITQFSTTVSSETVIDSELSSATQLADPDVETVVDGGTQTETVVEGVSVSTASGSTSGSRIVSLDVRSDIYSLGATLYHLLTGKRPAKKAEEVEPISRELYSPQLAAIIEKAMSPSAEKRYQTADEMLFALSHIRSSDPRTIRLKKQKRVSAIAVTALLIGGVLMSFTGLRQMQQTERSHALAEYAENALAAGDKSGALSLAMQAFPEKGLFTPPYTAQARAALADALGVYDLSDGFKLAGTVGQSTETIKLALSPSGKTGAAVCLGELTIFDTASGQSRVKLPLAKSALADAVFIDDNTLVYAGKDGLTAFSLKDSKTLWTAGPALKIAVSADGKTVAAAGRDDGAAVVYGIDGTKKGSVSFGGKKLAAAANDSFADPGDILFRLNANGSLLAVSFADGSMSAFDTSGGGNDLEIADPGANTHYEGGFCGKYLAFSATGSDSSVFDVIDTAALAETGGFTLPSRIGVLADESGVYISNKTTVVKIDPESGEQQELAYTDKDVSAFCRTADFTLVLTADNACSFFDKTAKLLSRTEGGDKANLYAALAGDYAVLGGLDSPDVHILRLENHADTQVGSYDPSCAHDELRLNEDGSAMMLFDYKGFRVCSLDGKVLCETSLPDPEQVYDQQYRRDDKGSRLDVIYNDGTVRSYSGNTGKLISETKEQKPDGSARDIFYTDKLKIDAPLHGNPVVYSRKSGKKLCELQEDAYLTYVTQLGDCVVTEYITEKGERYGLVLDENCETVAKLPKLCDIRSGELYFDYRSGSVRKTHFYSTDELLKLAAAQKAQ